MDPSRISYDKGKKTLTYDASEVDGVFPVDVGRELGAVLRSGSWKDDPVSSVEVAFRDEQVAKKNVDALAYLGLVARYPGGRIESELSFEARSDFGIEDA